MTWFSQTVSFSKPGHLDWLYSFISLVGSYLPGHIQITYIGKEHIVNASVGGDDQVLICWNHVKCCSTIKADASHFSQFNRIADVVHGDPIILTEEKEIATNTQTQRVNLGIRPHHERVFDV